MLLEQKLDTERFLSRKLKEEIQNTPLVNKEYGGLKEAYEKLQYDYQNIENILKAKAEHASKLSEQLQIQKSHYEKLMSENYDLHSRLVHIESKNRQLSDLLTKQMHDIASDYCKIS